MMPSPTFSLATDAVRCATWRRGVVIAAVALAVQVPVDLHYADGEVLAAIRIAWCALLVAAALVMSPARPRATRAALVAGATFSAVAVSVMIARSGGSQGPRFGFMMGFPLIVYVLVPDLPLVAAVVGAGTLLGGAGMLRSEGRDAWWLVEWFMLAGIGAGFAVIAAVTFRRTRIAELEALQATADAQRDLADSERKRGQMERLALAGRIAAGVGHEINNPLSFVKANVAYLKARTGEAGPAYADCAEAADEALQGVERIAQIVADLRALARDREDVLGPCDVEQVAREALRLAGGRLAGAQVEAAFEPGLPRVEASERLLVQALVNLLANAGDAVAVAAPERRWVRLTAAREAEAVVLRVEDGGPGLAPEVERHLFEPFFTTKGVSGTGLGLALTREQVERCRGGIEAANQPGGGAVFTVRLRPAA